MQTYILIIGIYIHIHYASSQSMQCIKSDTLVNGKPIECSGQLLFSDEFDGSALDTFRWDFTSNSYLLNGELHMKVDSETAVISKFNFRYGRVDIRAKIPPSEVSDIGFGFSTLENNSEHKIYIGNMSNLNHALVYYTTNPWHHFTFHTFTVIWHPASFEYKIDGESVTKIQSHLYHDTGERKISLEISKDFRAMGKSEMIIDYVRVYSTDPNEMYSPCELSVSALWPPTKSSTKPICKGDVIFGDFFNQLDDKKWMHEVQGPRDNRDEEFCLCDGVATVSNGILSIKPILWQNYRPDLGILRSTLNLTDRCTSIRDKNRECILRSFGQFIMPPVVAPRLTTRNSFAFKYGRIEIRAKFPKGDWIVPLLLLEPYVENYGKTGYESGQLRVAIAKGNENLQSIDGKIIDGRTLYGGPVLSNEAQWREYFMVNLTRNKHFGEAFHSYAMEWTPDRIEFYIDGESYGILRSNFKVPLLNKRWNNGDPMAPFDCLFYITLGVSIGGFGDFTDGIKSSNYIKPWMNNNPKARFLFWQENDKWHPTWKHPELLIDFIRVTAL